MTFPSLPMWQWVPDVGSTVRANKTRAKFALGRESVAASMSRICRPPPLRIQIESVFWSERHQTAAIGIAVSDSAQGSHRVRM